MILITKKRIQIMGAFLSILPTLDISVDKSQVNGIFNNFHISQMAYFLVINATHSTWHERVLLIALSEPKSLFLVVISPVTLLFLRKQVKGKIFRKSSYFSKQVKGNLGQFHTVYSSPLGNRSTKIFCIFYNPNFKHETTVLLNLLSFLYFWYMCQHLIISVFLVIPKYLLYVED